MDANFMYIYGSTTSKSWKTCVYTYVKLGSTAENLQKLQDCLQSIAANKTGFDVKVYLIWNWKKVYIFSDGEVMIWYYNYFAQIFEKGGVELCLGAQNIATYWKYLPGFT